MIIFVAIMVLMEMSNAMRQMGWHFMHKKSAVRDTGLLIFLLI